MNLQMLSRTASAITAVAVLGSCASMENVISAPSVQLKSVRLASVDLRDQTFLLGFDVVNPNPFPLPIESIRYGITLDGYRFASGETAGGFSVPAQGDNDFSISVSLDLMRTAPALFWLVRDAAHRDIPYRLDGQFGVDLPFARPLAFSSSGHIRVHSGQ